ncbi:MAG: hypothetical protein MJ061_05905, partial [Mailhella sp.]|nr:hypothetical protein [Mailhella sp.]
MDLPSWAAGFPGLIWELEPRNSRIRILGGSPFPGLGDDTARLLKDARFRRESVLEQDAPLIEEFWEMAESETSASVAFRLKKSGRTFVLLGWPLEGRPGFYGGLLTERVSSESFLANGSVAECQLALGRAQYPVVVINTFQKEIVTFNRAAAQLFRGVEEDVFLDGIVPGGDLSGLMVAAEQALENGVWAGTLMLRDGGGSTIGAKVRITPCTAGRDVVRMALLKVQDKAPERPRSSAPSPADPIPSLREGLDSLLASHPELEGLMFSDIRSSAGTVEVYGVGRLFSRIAWGAPHAYEGTIAQDIERYGLESMTVEDTHDSIKSIDWALFIPCGVRSYFAKPFYGPEGLHAVLILASSKKG